MLIRDNEWVIDARLAVVFWVCTMLAVPMWPLDGFDISLVTVSMRSRVGQSRHPASTQWQWRRWLKSEMTSAVGLRTLGRMTSCLPPTSS